MEQTVGDRRFKLLPAAMECRETGNAEETAEEGGFPDAGRTFHEYDPGVAGPHFVEAVVQKRQLDLPAHEQMALAGRRFSHLDPLLARSASTEGVLIAARSVSCL
jgi:hypothetical protein